MAPRVANLSLLPAHVRVPPAMEAILSAEGNQVQGFLAAGHVGAVMGTAELRGWRSGIGCRWWSAASNPWS